MTLRPAAALLALAIGACSGILDSGGRGLSIALESQAPLPAPLVFRVIVGGRAYDVAGEAGSAARRSVDVRAPSADDVPVRAQLLGAAGDTLAEASFVQRFEDDSEHWVQAVVGERRPIGHCIGHLVALPIRPALERTRADSLFVVYGGIPRGAVC